MLPPKSWNFIFISNSLCLKWGEITLFCRFRSFMFVKCFEYNKNSVINDEYCLGLSTQC